ncbi:MAG: aldehyde dehydrogenase (NAD+) [Bradymonadia bacterium]|jgi:aldehyde dehydrogenase (NAD+)
MVVMLTFSPSDVLDGVRGPGLSSVEGAILEAISPIDGSVLAKVRGGTPNDVSMAATVAVDAFTAWRTVPAPRRGALVRRIGELVRENKAALANVITLEVGKIRSEAEGEVQEWIDVCEFAVGLSRQLHGKTIVSERPNHRMMEQWHPLGPVGCITAFNFPMAVWAWNAMLAFVCGDSVVWKPSEKASLCALAVHEIVKTAIAEMPEAPAGLATLVVGGQDCGEAIAADKRFPLISATGSVRMGRSVASVVGARLGKTLLELGGNNAAIVTPSADLKLAMRGIVFGAVGTCGQRCTSLRRLIVHESQIDEVCARLTAAYGTLTIGDPREPSTLVGPLIDGDSAAAMDSAIAEAEEAGGVLLSGGGRVLGESGGTYVRPAVMRVASDCPPAMRETFAPLLYVMPYSTLSEAIAVQNSAHEGLSSAIFTESIREAELFLSAAGSDCGIANVNIGTSGAEIGGAFGGEKDTGGGRESGSDSWRAYMRRTTNTINYGNSLPLAQGVEFPIE